MRLFSYSVALVLNYFFSVQRKSARHGEKSPLIEVVDKESNELCEFFNQQLIIGHLKL